MVHDRADGWGLTGARRRAVHAAMRAMTVGLLIAAATPAWAQPKRPGRAPTAYEQQQNVKIERAAAAGVEDVSPMAAGLEQVQLQSATPIGFEQVLVLQGVENRYARANGGLYALFPQSVYASPSGRGAPLVPPGTVFYLNPPREYAMNPLPTYEPSPNAIAPPRIDTRIVEDGASPSPPRRGTTSRRAATDVVRDRRAPAIITPFTGPETEPPAILSNETYRRSRIRELMSRAAESESDAG